MLDLGYLVVEEPHLFQLEYVNVVVSGSFVDRGASGQRCIDESIFVVATKSIVDESVSLWKLEAC